MYLEAQTRRLAQTVLLLSASSFCGILLCMAAVNHGRGTATSQPAFQVYTYQNPFKTVNQDPAIASGPATVPGRLMAPQFVLGVLSLGILWFSSALYLERQRKSRRHAHRKIIPVSNPEPKMNPLAILPRAMARASKEDISCRSVFGRTTTLCSTTRKRLAVPCQSRFRPVHLMTDQKRFHRL